MFEEAHVLIRLSYNLSPSFPASDNLLLEQRKYVAGASVLNLFAVHLAIDHQGTHLDSPYHFYEQGKRIIDFPVDGYFFDHPLVVDVPKNDAELVTVADLTPCADKIAGCDLLLLRTGFSRYRLSDWSRYARSNPGVSGDAARYLMENFRSIRAVGLDTVSLEYEGNHEHGFPAHHAFLSNLDHPMLIIEDVNLDFDLSGLARVMALPLYVEEVGGFPCTVVAELAG